MKAWAVSVSLVCAKGTGNSITFTIKESRDDAMVQAVFEALAVHHKVPEHNDCLPSVIATSTLEIPKDVLRAAASEVCRGEEE